MTLSDIWHLIHPSLPSNIVLIVQLNWSLDTSLPPPDEVITKLNWDKGRVYKNQIDKRRRGGCDRCMIGLCVDRFPENCEEREAGATFRYSESEFRIDWPELFSPAWTIVALLGSLTLTIMFNADSN